MRKLSNRTRKLSNRTMATVAAVLLLLAGAGVAFAYWTAGGTGTGSATTGTGSDITANQTSVVAGLAPGGAAQDISGNFTNGTGAAVHVNTVTVSIGTVTKASGAPAGTCTAADYTLANAVSTVDADVATGTGGSWGTTDTPTIAFNNDPAANQDGCKGATVALDFVIA
jgi:hypothetical protein